MFIYSFVKRGHFIIKSGQDIIWNSIHCWMFHLKKEKIIFMTDIEHTLWVVYYSPERFMSCSFHNNVERVNLMTDSNGFLVIGKDQTTSFYSISDILEQIHRSMSPVIAPILSSNATFVGGRYVASYVQIGEKEIEVKIFDATAQRIFDSFQMLGTQMLCCQLIQDDSVFFIYTDIECLYISINREILLRSRVEIIGNIIFVQKKIKDGFEVYLFDILKNDVVHHFRIQGTQIEFNHVLTMDDGSMVFRAYTECADCKIVVDK